MLIRTKRHAANESMMRWRRVLLWGGAEDIALLVPNYPLKSGDAYWYRHLASAPYSPGLLHLPLSARAVRERLDGHAHLYLHYYVVRPLEW